MFKEITELYGLLTNYQKKRFIFLQVLMTFSAFLELIGIASIAPFMAVISDKDILYGVNILAELYRFTEIREVNDFIFYMGVCIIVLLMIGTFVSIHMTRILARFGQNIGVSLGDRLFKFYLNQSWIYHASNNSSNLIKNIMTESVRVSNGIITPLLQLNSRIFIVIFIAVTLLIYDPVVSVYTLLILSFLYVVIYKIVSARLAKNSKLVSSSMEGRFKLASEGFGGIKEILLHHRHSVFENNFLRYGVQYANSQSEILTISQAPRYLVELLIFGSLIIFLLYLVNLHGSDMGVILPIVSLYALAGFKLLPAFQQIYSCIATIKGNISAFDQIKRDINYLDKGNLKSTNNIKGFSLDDSIFLKDISYTYPGEGRSVLQGLNLTIPVNHTVGIMGPSGSGKSTIIDILLGLIHPDKGELTIDHRSVTLENVDNWQSKIGFVPQDIFLSDASIIENIAFGINASEINVERVWQSIKLAHLDQLVQGLPEGLNTMVGERGVQLSGGQRQRIGIARALYNNPDVIVFDEATSSLDSASEKYIMDAIYDFKRSKTIIMIAHRLTTLKECDVIYFVDNGKVMDNGTFEYLMGNNSEFKKMANLSLSD